MDRIGEPRRISTRSGIGSASPAASISHATLIGEGKKVFLDFKLHDIGNTVSEGVAAVASLGVDLLTVHAYPQTMRAAVRGRGDASMKLLAVTVPDLL